MSEAALAGKFKNWQSLSVKSPKDLASVAEILMENRRFEQVAGLVYGDHGLAQVVDAVEGAIRLGKRIGLYADYDVDGTMSCVAWIWFLESLGYRNFVHYIPCRFKEGYGLNLKAIEHLIDDEKAELIITMDTGITANAEAAYCRARGVEFICTDHHVIQPEKMPDCIILNPKMHPDAMYQELCGCGITFVLLRKLGERLNPPAAIWTDLLALTGMATICDVVPLNGVNHRLAKLGVAALSKSQRPVLRQLMAACQTLKGVDEKDVGFRLGPRINAVGRLEHADLVIQAFVGNDPEPLIAHMDSCNEERKRIQKNIVEAARREACKYPGATVLFLGGEWHPGVVGIAASKIAEEFWCPVWLFQRKDGVCKGSARSIKGFDVTAAMTSAASLFTKFGGHAAAGGFTFPAVHEEALRTALNAHAAGVRAAKPELWDSCIAFDCELAPELATLALTEQLDGLKPFGHGFEEPKFRLDVEVASTRFFYDKESGEPRHTCVMIQAGRKGTPPQKVMFFNEVHAELTTAKSAKLIVSVSRSTYRGETSLMLMGHDFRL